MNAETLEAFRICILQILRVAAPHAVPVSRIVNGLVVKGFTTAEAAHVQAELGYLSDKKLAAEEEKSISPENAWWRIAAEGRDFLAKRGM